MLSIFLPFFTFYAVRSNSMCLTMKFSLGRVVLEGCRPRPTSESDRSVGLKRIEEALLPTCRVTATWIMGKRLTSSDIDTTNSARHIASKGTI